MSRESERQEQIQAAGWMWVIGLVLVTIGAAFLGGFPGVMIAVGVGIWMLFIISIAVDLDCVTRAAEEIDDQELRGDPK